MLHSALFLEAEKPAKWVRRSARSATETPFTEPSSRQGAYLSEAEVLGTIRQSQVNEWQSLDSSV
jgi:hypothetical protein